MSSTVPGGLSVSRRWIGAALGYFLLILVPLLLALVGLGAKFPGLRTPLALEHADLARRLSAGEGYTTGSIRPLSLAFHPGSENHPDLYHAPGHPLFLAAVYLVAGPSDRATATAGVLLWVVVFLLTFFLARRWFGTGAAVAATVLVSCNVALMQSAIFGLPYPLCALFLLSLAWLAAPDPRTVEEADRQPRFSRYRLAAIGAVSGLAALTHYGLFLLVPVMAFYLAFTRRRRWRALSFFGSGLLVALLPWMLHNISRGFSPVFSLYWYESMAGTDGYPSDTIWRTMSAAGTNPLGHILFHPFQIFRKFMGGMSLFWNESLTVLNPVAFILFVCSLFAASTLPRWRSWLITIAAGLGMCAIGSCFLRPEPEILLVWAPVLSIAAGAFVVKWVGDRLKAVSMRNLWGRRWVRSSIPDPERLRGVVRGSLAGAILALATFPMLHYLGASRTESRTPGRTADVEKLQTLLREDGTVMTDQPAFVTWYADRRSLWLFADEADWDEMEHRFGAIDAAYVTPGMTAFAPRDAGMWWWWLAAPRGNYRKLVPADPGLDYGMLRVRRDGERG